jgi:hypothetical protein
MPVAFIAIDENLKIVEPCKRLQRFRKIDHADSRLPLVIGCALLIVPFSLS